jgi:hypothetical protein
MPGPLTRKLTIIAQDPTVRVGRRILRPKIPVPAEVLAAGPWGHRVQVIDDDARGATSCSGRKRARTTTRTQARLMSALSMLSGKHGSAQKKTESPRRTLGAALGAETELFTTQDLKPSTDRDREIARVP